MPEFEPDVNLTAEFLEISNDFTNPQEIVREAISNAFDAGAHDIGIEGLIDRSSGDDELVVRIEDDGEGMGEDQIRAFFGLGISTRRQKNEYGEKSTAAIGEKGHGTKIYFNSRRIEVTTVQAGNCIQAFMDSPRKMLRRGQLPTVCFSKDASDQRNGTRISIIGYNDNNQFGFSHSELKDYIYWFTKFGSPELEFGDNAHRESVVRLRGLGWRESDPQKLQFGHRFPDENTDIRSLRQKDKVSPLDYYVAKWVFPNRQVIGMPNSTLDFIFVIEGDQAKRTYNPMIHRRYTAWQPGEYPVEQRYGLWLCKDFIPIARKNEWISERSEWTKYHAFVNSQDFRLTANRGDLDNTPPAVMQAIRDTVQNLFKTQVVPTPKFQKYLEELEKQQQYRDAEQEEQDFKRRREASFRKRVAELDGHLLFEPRQEGGVFSIFLQLMTLKPNLFDFKIVDYDTAMGYDLLVTKDYQLDLNRAALRFVEMKFELTRDFNHSFKKLAAIVCWDTKLSNEDDVRDLTGATRRLKITRRGDDPESYTKYMLVADDEPVNIEVYVLKDFIRERLGQEFRPRVKE